MAAVTLDKTIAPNDQLAIARFHVFTYTGPTSYATGGDTGLAEALGWGIVFAVFGGIISNGTASLLVYFVPATGALMVFDMAGAEITALTNLSTYSGRLAAVGR